MAHYKHLCIYAKAQKYCPLLISGMLRVIKKDCGFIGKTVEASSKVTPCFSIFFFALTESHWKIISFIIIL